MKHESSKFRDSGKIAIDANFKMPPLSALENKKVVISVPKMM